MEWISVKDRLPKVNELVLVNLRDWSLPGMAIFIDKNDYHWDWKVQPLFSVYFGTNNGVTHWMPLPKPLEECIITVEIQVDPRAFQILTINEIEERVKNAVRNAI